MERKVFWKMMSKRRVGTAIAATLFVVGISACVIIFRNSISNFFNCGDEIEKEVTYEETDQYSISIAKSTSWENDDGYGSIYTITITNENDEIMDGWNLSLDIPENADLYQYWCGDFEKNEDIVNISALDYNSTVNKNLQASCGFILNSEYDVPIEDITIQFNGKSYPESQITTDDVLTMQQ